MDNGLCKHGLRPWWDCESCRKSSKYGFTGFSTSGPAFSEEPLVLGETLTEDGMVRT